MDMHNGQLFVQSEGEEKGSTFVMLLPVAIPTTEGSNLETRDIHSIFPVIGESSRSNLELSSAKSYGLKSESSDKEAFVINQVYNFSSDTETSHTSSTLNGNNHESESQVSATKDEDKHHTFESEGGTSHYNKLTISIIVLISKSFTAVEDIKSVRVSRKTSVMTVTDVDIEAPLRVVNILIVDDSGPCRLMTERSLSTIDKDGCRICCDQASDGQKALDMIKLTMNSDSEAGSTVAPSSIKAPSATTGSRKKVTDVVTVSGTYDLILMDYQMPNLDGPTAIKHIRTLGYIGQIVGLTGNVFGSEVEFMHQSGADKVLSKPVQLSDLENLVLEL